MKRRNFVKTTALTALGALLINPLEVAAAKKTDPMETKEELNDMELPEGIREQYVTGVNGLTVHVLEAGFETPKRPAILLLHGFPELAYSWRKVMLPLAAAGYHVIAPDSRGYGRTTGADTTYDGNFASFRTHELSRDALGLMMAMGHDSVHTVIGHDVGAIVAAYCALVRPDFFRSVVLLSCPFGGVPPLPFGTGVQAAPNLLSKAAIQDPLAALSRPRKDSTTYFSSRNANNDLLNCEQGLHDFQRAYFHVKSADWSQNKPFPLTSGTAEEFAKQPSYYVLDLDKTMPESVAPNMPSQKEIASCKWLPDNELDIYTQEFKRTGFQGGLNWYRCTTSGLNRADLELFSGRTIDVPSCFISGIADWARFRPVGALEQMQHKACTKMQSFHIIEDAGHWVQQEQPEQLTGLIVDFLKH
ncbi:alpha/beta hydrolase [Flavobacterium sp.]|uniref:alpha/beta fold hydrolase n=1 Tax=Flavobacterium sp. TaxID=239 RepID=UPI003266C27B